MNPDLKRLRLRQLDAILSPLSALRQPVPRGGWIAAIRQALGMTLKQLGQRLGIDPAGVKRFQNREVSGAITLASLARAAAALDCDLVYALVPRAGLEQTLERQARAVARARLARVGQTMALEAQGVSRDEMARQEQELVQRLLLLWPSTLWDERMADTRD